MNTRVLLIVVAVLLLLSASLNVLQFRNFDTRQDEWRETYALESLNRLGVGRTILVDSGDLISAKSLKLLHGQLLVDLTRVQTAIADFSPAYQERFEQIRVELDDFRASNPKVFGRENTIMDDSMYSRYLDWISDGAGLY